MTEGGADVLELLARHEPPLKELNEAFADRFPAHRDLRHGTAGEEQKHVDRLRAPRAEGDAHPPEWFAGRIKAQAVRLSTDYVQRQASRARQGGVSLQQALAIGRDLESALLERQSSRVEEPLPTGVRAVLRDLAADTDRHRKAFAAALAAAPGWRATPRPPARPGARTRREGPTPVRGPRARDRTGVDAIYFWT